jgi:hypothetical protein
MKKISRKSITVTALIIVLIATAVALLFYLNNEKPTNRPVTAAVTSVVNVVNIMENGEYKVEMKDDTGRIYLINGTGAINRPRTPAEEKVQMECLYPDVRVGDRVTFNLPRDENSEYVSHCFPGKFADSYYFTILND